jgi:hypothetical protein
MKTKVFAFVMALVMLLSLAACAAANEPAEPSIPSEPEVSYPALSEFYDTISADYSLPALTDMDAVMQENFLPGIADISLSESVMKTPAISAAVCEILMVKCENADDAAAVKAIFDARVQSQIDGGAWYPASIEQWQKAEVVTAGAYVAMFAGQDAARMASMFTETFA